MAKMMKTAQEMQGKMTQMQDELDNIIITGESGAGLVTVTATAKGSLTGLNIDASIFDPNEKEVVEDLILAAIKDNLLIDENVQIRKCNDCKKALVFQQI